MGVGEVFSFLNFPIILENVQLPNIKKLYRCVKEVARSKLARGFGLIAKSRFFLP